jgi:hypothetical protein
MLSEKMTLFGEAIKLHKEPWIHPYLVCQLLDV